MMRQFNDLDSKTKNSVAISRHLISTLQNCYVHHLHRDHSATAMFGARQAQRRSTTGRAVERNSIARQCFAVCLTVATTCHAGTATTNDLKPWNFERGDCRLQVISTEAMEATVQVPAHHQFLLSAGIGSRAYASVELAKTAPVISELKIRIRLKASQPSLQLFVRAVLPRSDSSDGPQTVLLPGPTYSRVGEWQTLELSNLPELLEKHVRVHRATSDAWLDTREAFIDMVAVNVYGRPGQAELFLAQPDVDGVHVERSRTEAELSSVQPPTHTTNHQIRISNAAITIDGRLFAPRVVKPNGERWLDLKQLGFNTIWLKSIPSAEQMATAEKLDLWLIARVPPLTHYKLLDSHLYRRVLAWDLQTGQRSHESQEFLADQIRYACGAACKPLLCSDPDVASSSRFADIVVHGDPPLGSTQTFRDYETRLAQQVTACRPNVLHMAILQSHLPAQVLRQVALYTDAPERSAVAVQPMQVWAAATIAHATGIQTVCVADSVRLDLDDAPSRSRTLAIRRLNRLGQLIAPWLLSGEAPSISATPVDSLRLATFATNRSTLAIPLYGAPNQQLCPQPTPQQFHTLTIQHGGDAANVYLVQFHNVEKLPSKRVAGGTSFTTDALDDAFAILLTTDDRIAGSVSAKLRKMRRSFAEDQQRIAEQLIARTSPTQLVSYSQTNTAGPSSAKARAKRRLVESRSAMRTGDWSTAQQLAWAATSAAQEHARNEWEQELLNQSPAICALAASDRLLPELRRWRTGVPRTARAVNLLPSGQFESLDQLLADGWIAHKTSEAVDIALTDRGRSGKCLRIATTCETANPQMHLAWVESAPLKLETGTQVRIDGRVRVQPSGRASATRAMVFDSWTGPALAHRWEATIDWQRFTMFRICTGEPLTVHCALTGSGELLVDDLQVSPIVDASVDPSRR